MDIEPTKDYLQNFDLKAKFLLPLKHFSLDVDLTIAMSGVTGIFGHSGSGKTTLLRLIAGLIDAPEGQLRLGDECWQDGKYFVAPHKRAIGYVFQEGSLFSHLTAGENLNFAIKRAATRRNFYASGQVHGFRGRGDNPRNGDLTASGSVNYAQLIDILDIEKLLDSDVDQLSGGERQRVAIARALLSEPAALLMDEPFASLDETNKNRILPYLDKIKKLVQIPILYVTHSLSEITRLADDLIILEKGKVVAQGAVQEVLSEIDSPVALGEQTGSIVFVTITEKDTRWSLVKGGFNNQYLWFRDNNYHIGDTVRLRILARDISLTLTPHHDSSIVNIIPATVQSIKQDEHPGLTLVSVVVSSDIVAEVTVSTPAHNVRLISRMSSKSAHALNLCEGLNVWLQIKSVAVL